MDLGVVDLDADTTAFVDDVSHFLDQHLTPSLSARVLETGDSHDQGFLEALGRRGWIVPTWPHAEGGAGLDAFSASLLEHLLFEREAPLVGRALTLLAAIAIQQYGTGEQKADFLPRIASGEISLCLGYTEPDCGSDLAAVQTRAARQGSDWVINGSKMFTTNAHRCQYCFLLARTNPNAPKHKGLTTFLVPLDSPGVDIQPILTMEERTNVVFYNDVRLSDYYRLGPIDAGWTTIRGPLDAEHKMQASSSKPVGVNSTNLYARHLERCFAHVIDWTLTTDLVSGQRPFDDPTVQARLGEIVLALEAARCTTGPMARVATADSYIAGMTVLLDILGPAGSLSRGTTGCIAEGEVLRHHARSQISTIYGGSTDIFRNIIATTILGLPRST